MFRGNRAKPYRRPALDNYLRSWVQVGLVKSSFKPTWKDIDDVVDLIEYLCWQGPIQGERPWENLGREGMVEKFLPFGPAIVIPLLHSEAIFWHGAGRDQHFIVEYVTARVIDYHRPASYAIVDTLATTRGVGEATEKVLNEFNRRGVRVDEFWRRTEVELIYSLVGLAWPRHSFWPSRSEEVRQWAEEKLNNPLEWVEGIGLALSWGREELHDAKKRWQEFGKDPQWWSL